MCGNAIRYVFFVQHEKWPSLEVGETCCDHLTDTTKASDHMDSVRRFESRRQRFIHSKRWKPGRNGVSQIHQKGANLSIELIGQSYRLLVNNTQGKRRFPSINEAKSFAFELFENGKLDAFLENEKRKR